MEIASTQHFYFLLFFQSLHVQSFDYHQAVDIVLFQKLLNYTTNPIFLALFLSFLLCSILLLFTF
jgi:hypothetical protein